jgi:hypothetical protein
MFLVRLYFTTSGLYRLDEKEFAIIKSHPFYTYYVIKPIDGLDKVAEWAAFHHEKLDGSGYPFHGASANPASPPTNRHHLFHRFQMASLLWPSPKKCTAQIAQMIKPLTAESGWSILKTNVTI